MFIRRKRNQHTEGKGLANPSESEILVSDTKLSLPKEKKRQRKDCYRQDIMWLHAQEGKIIRNGIKGTK